METTATQTIKNRVFTDEQGMEWTVWDVRGVAERGFWTGHTESVAMYAENTDGVRVDVPAGCSFKASDCVKEAMSR